LKPSVAAEGLLHPAALAAAAVLAFNDQLGKALWPGTVTGKLSDFAGLLVFPLFLQAAWELVRPQQTRSLRVLVTAAIATAVVFALVKTWPPASAAYRVVFGVLRWPLDAVLSASLPPLRPVRLTPDVTDLVALPAVLVAVWAGVSRAGESRPAWARLRRWRECPPRPAARTRASP